VSLSCYLLGSQIYHYGYLYEIITCNTMSSQCYADYFCGGVTNVKGCWNMSLTSAQHESNS
jgi:hypothetical protein